MNKDNLAAYFRRISSFFARGGSIGRAMLFASLSLIFLVCLYYFIGMGVIHKIDDAVDFQPSQSNPGESKTIAMAISLINREVNENGWVANDPFFMPGYLLDNMPNYQQGIIYAISRFAMEMTDQIGRSRGSSEVDSDLDKASGLLKYPGTTWIFDLSTSIAPTASSEAQYKSAMRSLTSYNKRLAKGAATFDKRADNLQATLRRFTADLGSNSAAISEHLARSGGWGIDSKSDDIFYSAKGRLYAYYLLLKELEADFKDVVAGKELSSSWNLMLGSLKQASRLSPLVIANGQPDGAIVPSHLASLGFYLLRARTQLREIIDILEK